MNKPRRQTGFTLLEMIIAIALTAVVAAMAYQSLDAASRNAEATRELLTDVNQLDKAWQLIAQDMRTVIPTNAQQATSQTRFEGASLKGKGGDSYQVVLAFARRGWDNPLGRLRSDLQQVSYRIAAGKLWRDFVPERNFPLEQLDFERAAYHQLLLDNVVDIQLRFLSEARIKNEGKSVLEGSDYSNRWDITWPPQGVSGVQPSPIALEITLELAGGARSVRLFQIPRA